MISLSKNQTISLKKESSNLKKLHFGLGWDSVKTAKKGFLANLFGSGKNIDIDIDIDLDASCMMLDIEGKKLDAVSFLKLKSKCNSIIHTGDNLTGEGNGDDEVILVDLTKLPLKMEYLVFTVNSFRGQTFNQVANAFCRVLDQDQKQLAYYQLTEQGAHTGIIIATLKRNGGAWDFTAQGFPCSGKTISDIYPEILSKVVKND